MVIPLFANQDMTPVIVCIVYVNTVCISCGFCFRAQEEEKEHLVQLVLG